MRAKDGKFHIIYKTTNITDGMFYVGRHSSRILEDTYLGSGTWIRRAVKKYGKQNFKREILEFATSLESLKIREKQIVNEDMLGNKECMNLRKGGDGWDSVEASRVAALGNKSAKRNHSVSTAKANATKKKNGYKPTFTFFDGMLGKNHSTESRKQMSSSKTGEANNRFGTCWVTNGEKSVSVVKEQLDEYLAKGFRRGRVINKAGKVFMDTHESSKLE